MNEKEPNPQHVDGPLIEDLVRAITGTLRESPHVVADDLEAGTLDLVRGVMPALEQHDRRPRQEEDEAKRERFHRAQAAYRNRRQG